MQIDTKRRPPVLNATLPLLFAALSVGLLLLFLIFNDLFLSVRYEDPGDSWDIVLPYARTARPDENPEPERLLLCIDRDGTIYISGLPKTDEEVRHMLTVESRLSRTPQGTAERTVLIAADEGAPFKAIKKIVELCNSRDIRIWRLSFATRPAEEPGVWHWRWDDPL